VAATYNYTTTRKKKNWQELAVEKNMNGKENISRNRDMTEQNRQWRSQKFFTGGA